MKQKKKERKNRKAHNDRHKITHVFNFDVLKCLQDEFNGNCLEK
jgi:uncharacterized SAM-dependent methyltransferase